MSTVGGCVGKGEREKGEREREGRRLKRWYSRRVYREGRRIRVPHMLSEGVCVCENLSRWGEKEREGGGCTLRLYHLTSIESPSMSLTTCAHNSFIFTEVCRTDTNTSQQSTYSHNGTDRGERERESY